MRHSSYDGGTGLAGQVSPPGYMPAESNGLDRRMLTVTAGC